MPRVAKKSTVKAKRPSQRLRAVDDVRARVADSFSLNKTLDFSKFLTTKYLVVVAVVVLLALLLWKNKSLLVVASVNGQPIPRWELESRMVNRYGNQTLDEVINETLIRQAGREKGVNVSPKDVDGKIAEIDKSLGGKISLSDALAQQGMTMADFRGQVELQLVLDKLVSSSIAVTDKEVSNYIASNSASLTSSDPASQSAEAKNILLSQKKNVAYRQIFNDLKAKAKISKFL